MVLSHHSKNLVRCDYCHKPVHNVYKAKFGDFTYQFCCGDHLGIASKNFQENSKKNYKIAEEENGQPEGTEESL